MKSFPDFNLALQTLEEFIDVLSMDVQIDLAAILSARPSARAEHDPAITVGQFSPNHLTVVIAGVDYEKPNRFVPVDRRSDVRHMDHWRDSLLHAVLFLSAPARLVRNLPNSDFTRRSNLELLPWIGITRYT